MCIKNDILRSNLIYGNNEQDPLHSLSATSAILAMI